MALTATPLPTTGGVQLVLTASVTHRLRSLIRTDANGARPVRLLVGQDLSAGSLVVVDHEAALVGPVLYRAATSTAAAPTVLTQHSVSTTLTGLRDRDRIASATRPATGVSPLLVTAVDAVRPHASAVHDVIDRADPLVSIGVQGTRRGAMSVLCETYDNARTLVSVLGSGDIIMWRQTEYAGLDMYLTVLTTSPAVEDATTEPRLWSVTLDYVEQPPPPDPILGALGWTVSGLAASGLTVASVPALYPTVTALTIGPSA